MYFSSSVLIRVQSTGQHTQNISFVFCLLIRTYHKINLHYLSEVQYVLRRPSGSYINTEPRFWVTENLQVFPEGYCIMYSLFISMWLNIESHMNGIQNKVCPVYLLSYVLRTTFNIWRTTRIMSVLFPPSTSLPEVSLSYIMWHSIIYVLLQMSDVTQKRTINTYLN